MYNCNIPIYVIYRLGGPDRKIFVDEVELSQFHQLSQDTVSILDTIVPRFLVKTRKLYILCVYRLRFTLIPDEGPLLETSNLFVSLR